MNSIEIDCKIPFQMNLFLSFINMLTILLLRLYTNTATLIKINVIPAAIDTIRRIKPLSSKNVLKACVLSELCGTIH